jgi:hypothetical protein
VRVGAIFYKAIKVKYHAIFKKLAALKGKKVELNMLMTFEDDAARQRFEQGLTSQRGNVKPDKFIGSTPIKYEELHAAKYQIKKEVLKQGIDISVSGVQHLFTLAYQYIQISLLDKGLKGLNDSALIDKMSLMLAKSYLQLAVAAGDMLITSAKFYGLFFAKNKTLLDTLSKIGNKFGYIGKTITIIDSLGDMLNASKALTRGDTGSASFMINSTIGLIAACTLGLSMPWTIVLLIAPHLLNYLFGTYEDGSNWDEMEKWINRSIFGRFDHNDLFPPYPISDTGHYLSEQDYYLASRKGFCRTVHYQLTEQECYKERLANRDFKAPPMPASKVWGDDSIAYMNKVLESQADPYQNKPRYNLNLVMQLPDFVDEKAKFEGTVTIRHKDESQDTILAISDGDEALTITPIQCNAQYFFAVNDKMVRNDKKNERYAYLTEDKNTEEENKEDNPNRYWLAMQQVLSEPLTKDNLAANSDNKLSETTDTTTTEPNIGLFQINQMLGRVIGEFEVICVVKYWPEGKTDGDNHPLFPYLLSYQHNVLTMINSVKKSAVELFS